MTLVDEIMGIIDPERNAYEDRADFRALAVDLSVWHCKKMAGTPTPKAPQDMDLRELFDHVAIVADAVRAALLTHPGMTPAEREGI